MISTACSSYLGLLPIRMHVTTTTLPPPRICQRLNLHLVVARTASKPGQSHHQLESARGEEMGKKIEKWGGKGKWGEK